MRQFACFFLCLFLLCGCRGPQEELEAGIELRSKLLQAESCCFDAEITADYGEKLHVFVMHCAADSGGNLTFTVTEPETIAGITGKVTGQGGALTFEETALHFELLTDNGLSPISTPWILLKTLRSGNITSAWTEDGLIRLSMDDSFEEDALQLDIRLNRQKLPEYADILYDGRRILSVNLGNFQIL